MCNLRSVEWSNGSASLSCWTGSSGIATVTDILMSGEDDDGMPFSGELEQGSEG